MRRTISALLYIPTMPVAILLLATSDSTESQKFRSGVTLAFCTVILRIDSTQKDTKDSE